MVRGDLSPAGLGARRLALLPPRQAVSSSTGQRLENFTRVETFGNSAANGNNDVHWIRVTVNPRSRDVFGYQAMMVPGNRTAVPAP